MLLRIHYKNDVPRKKGIVSFELFSLPIDLSQNNMNKMKNINFGNRVNLLTLIIAEMV